MLTPQPSIKLYRGRVADQIVDDLRSQILSGKLEDGSRLPSERELAANYDVSVPTIREAVRVLTAMGLLNTRNGSRTTVTADGHSLLVMSIAAVVQFGNMGAGDVVGVLGALNAYAVEQAVERASDDEIAELRKAAEEAAERPDVGSSAEALKRFFVTLSAISHNPLLAALSRVITEFQIGLAVELSGGSTQGWLRVAGSLHPMRLDLVEAVEQRDAARAVQLVHDYHSKVIARTKSSPRAKEMRETDPGLADFLSTWLRSNVRLGQQPGGS
ncbi:MAG: GntR family transcriptional regulator, transcriptional repressor for pyruvate dehydrogenase complex [Kribbellaceae bacterium]|jgi:DNA-binding FadR family transcriptional regulator|nr:GntR family transcriptional regulator, transcriptional repressor for pyruvate dehydrogenase complex [Kribbellaceae bacterium]